MVRQITVGGGAVRTTLVVVAVVAVDVSVVVVVVDVTSLSSTRLPRIIGAYILRISFCAFFYFNRSNLAAEQWPQRRSRRCHTDLNQRRPAVFVKFALKKKKKEKKSKAMSYRLMIT